MSYIRPQTNERFSQLSFQFSQAAMDNAKANAKATKEKSAMASKNTNGKTSANGKANGNGKPKATNGAARKVTPKPKTQPKAEKQEFGDGSWRQKEASVAQTGKIYRLIGLDVRPLDLTRGQASDMIGECLENPKAARAKIIKRKGVINRKPLPKPVSDEEKARREIKRLERRLKKLAS